MIKRERNKSRFGTSYTAAAETQEASVLTCFFTSIIIL